MRLLGKSGSSLQANLFESRSGLPKFVLFPFSELNDDSLVSWSSKDSSNPGPMGPDGLFRVGGIKLIGNGCSIDEEGPKKEQKSW